MQLAAVRVGLGLAALASGTLVGFMIVHHPDDLAPPPAQAAPPPPPPAPIAKAISTIAPTALDACVKGVFVNERDVVVQTVRGWADAPALTATKKKPHLHPRDGDLDPPYASVRDGHRLAITLRDRDGQPIEELAVVRPRVPAVNGLGRIVPAHDVDDPDETPCAQAPTATTVWRTDPLVIEVRFAVAAGCPAVCTVVSTPRPAGLGEL